MHNSPKKAGNYNKWNDSQHLWMVEWATNHLNYWLDSYTHIARYMRLFATSSRSSLDCHIIIFGDLKFQMGMTNYARYLNNFTAFYWFHVIRQIFGHF